MIQKIENNYYLDDIKITANLARELYYYMDREFLKDDVITELEYYCEENNLDFNKISEITINNILNAYEDYRDNDDGWLTSLRSAVTNRLDELYNDLNK